MRVKLDENMPIRLADSLGSMGHDVETVTVITGLFQAEQIGVWVGCFVVVTDRKIRIHRPG